MLKGYCECRGVRFEVDGEIEDFSHCHCSQCRRLHGAAYATFAGVSGKQFRYTSGEELLGHYRSSPGSDRVFCSRCGSNILVATAEEPGMLYLSMSTLEGDPPRPPAYHIWVGSRAPWHDILDESPQFEEDPD